MESNGGEENTAVDYYISGYLYTDGKTWYNCSAVCVGKAGTKAANLTVRFGHDGSKCVVLLGETTSVWNVVSGQDTRLGRWHW